MGGYSINLNLNMSIYETELGSKTPYLMVFS